MWVLVVVVLNTSGIEVVWGKTPYKTLEACQTSQEQLEISKPDNLIGNTACVEIFQGRRQDV